MEPGTDARLKELMLELDMPEMSSGEMDYEEYPYKDYQGWHLHKGDLVQFAMDNRTYGKVYRLIEFTKDSTRALIASGSKTYWVTLKTLRWIG